MYQFVKKTLRDNPFKNFNPFLSQSSFRKVVNFFKVIKVNSITMNA